MLKIVKALQSAEKQYPGKTFTIFSYVDGIWTKLFESWSAKETCEYWYNLCLSPAFSGEILEIRYFGIRVPLN